MYTFSNENAMGIVTFTGHWTKVTYSILKFAKQEKLQVEIDLKSILFTVKGGD